MTSAHSRLTTELRELRARTGLSLAALAESTAYSKSSWERYLNGKALPPRQAVGDLCRLAGETDGRLPALWEIAESEWSGRARPVPAPASDEPAPGPEPPAPAPAWRRAGGRRLTAVLVSVCVVTALGVTAALLLLPHREGTPRASAASAAAAPAPGPRCHGTACEGQDPIHMVCGRAPDTLTTHRTATGARVELRYSGECGAGWARMYATRVGDGLTVTAGGPTRRARIADEVDAEAYVYTAMTTARPGTVLRACFRPAAAADSRRECFEARVGEGAPVSPASPVS